MHVLPLLDGQRSVVDGSLRRGLTLDLSEQGCLFSRVGYLPVDALVRLFVQLPDCPAQPMDCYGRVVRCDLSDRPRYGLRFVGLREEDAERLQRVVGPRRPRAPRVSGTR